MPSLRCPRGLMAGWGRDQVVGTMSSPSPHAGPDPDRFAPSSPGQRRTLPLRQSSAHRLRGEGWSVTVTGARDAGHCSECGMLIPFCFVSERTAPVASVLWRGRRQHRAGKSLAPGHAAKVSRISSPEPAVHPARPPSGFPAGPPTFSACVHLPVSFPRVASGQQDSLRAVLLTISSPRTVGTEGLRRLSSEHVLESQMPGEAGEGSLSLAGGPSDPGPGSRLSRSVPSTCLGCRKPLR